MKKKILPVVLISLLLLSGCSNSDHVGGEGNLQSYEDTTPMSNDNVIFGEVEVIDPVAIYEEPGGITVGRLGEGVYPVVNTDGNWIQLGFETTTPWVQADQVKLYIK